ncbi:hypothetical protein [Rhodococcus sp. I2R]|uniref:hypothetical protein n=1 Tax=Rhodococcus sp. I2R TaxID=2855445 RepID=UPI001E33FD62|nr:hypothetical protein [Rhodococcus sp. I2R]MCC8930817.1 hypothetical protein [Rhodococcus sp. I2R]
MAGQFIPLDGLDGRYASVVFDAVRGMITTEVADAEGNVLSSMSWGYSEPVVIEDPAVEG